MLDGDIVAGKFVRLACERHFADLASGAERGLYFDVAAADRAIRFFPAMFTIADDPDEKPFVLLDWQKFVVGSLFGWHRDGRLRFREVFVETGKGQAKALALDTPIATPSGWTTMGALRDGDEVYGANGRPCRVIKAHPVVVGQECYRVTFDDGAEIIANAGHLWRTEMRKSGMASSLKGVPVSERGAWRHGIRTTEQIAQTLRYKNGKHLSANHSVSLAKPLAGVEADLELHPYVMGAWLGDGDSDCARLTISPDDAPEVADILAPLGFEIVKQKATYRYGLKDMNAAPRKGVMAQLSAAGVLRNKHIPRQYFSASQDQRLALLQGLMDTDGTVTNGQCSFTATRKCLAEGVHELALSLGLKATINEGTARLNGADIGALWKVNFYAPRGFRVFRLERKQERVAPAHDRRRLSGDRRIVGCEKVESVPVRCITVDSHDSMFLCGREMIPTHNSPVMGGIGLYVAGFMGVPRAEVYYFAHKLDQAKVPFQDAANLARGLTPGYEDDRESRSMAARDEVFISGAGKNAWRIEFRQTGSYLEAKATTDSLSGPRPDAAFADEVHEFSSSKALTLWKAGINKKRGSAFLFMATNTPGADQAVCNEISERYQHILEGHVSDDTSFGYIARVDDEDDPFTDETCWMKALPALGVTFDAQNVRDQVRQAETDASARLTVSRLYFGIPIGTSDFWVDQASWRACMGEIPAAPEGKCYLSLDLSDRNDLTALAGVWKGRDDRLTAKVWYWTTAQGIERRSSLDRIDYRQYVKRGELEIVDRPAIDYRLVAERIRSIMAVHQVEALAIDPNYNLSRFISDCEEVGLKVWLYDGEDKPAGDGLKIIRHEQGGTVPFGGRKLCMPHSVERFKDKVLKREIVIEDSNLTAYCAANTGTALNKSNQAYFVKSRQMGRIDGMVALAMAVGASEGVKDAAPGSYMKRGVVFT